MQNRLCIYAVWSAPILFVYRKRFSRRGSCFLYSFKYHVHWVIIKPKSIINRVAADGTFRWKKSSLLELKISLYSMCTVCWYTRYCWSLEQQSQLQQTTNFVIPFFEKISHESLAGRWFTWHDVIDHVLILQVAKKWKWRLLVPL